MKNVTRFLVQIVVMLTAGFNGCMEFDDNVTGSPSAITNPNVVISSGDIPLAVTLTVSQSVFIIEPNITFTFMGILESSGNGDIPIHLDVWCPTYHKTIVLSTQQSFPGYTMEDGSQLAVGLKHVDRVGGAWQATIQIGRLYTR